MWASSSTLHPSRPLPNYSATPPPDTSAVPWPSPSPPTCRRNSPRTSLLQSSTEFQRQTQGLSMLPLLSPGLPTSMNQSERQKYAAILLKSLPSLIAQLLLSNSYTREFKETFPLSTPNSLQQSQFAPACMPSRIIQTGCLTQFPIPRCARTVYPKTFHVILFLVRAHAESYTSVDTTLTTGSIHP